MEQESQSTDVHRGLPGIAEVNGDGHIAEGYDDDTSFLSSSFKLKLSSKTIS